jgi:hypothetical protein
MRRWKNQGGIGATYWYRRLPDGARMQKLPGIKLQKAYCSPAISQKKKKTLLPWIVNPQPQLLIIRLSGIFAK